MVNIILLGPPGSGKGTIADLFHQHYSFPILASGELLRQEIKKKTLIGQKIASFIETGELVPDTIVNSLIEKELEKINTNQSLVFDGYPRTLNQAHALNGLLKTIPTVFYLDLPKSLLMNRLLERGRSDDTKEIINQRFAVYKEQTKALISYYQEKELLISLTAESSKILFEKISSYL